MGMGMGWVDIHLLACGRGGVSSSDSRKPATCIPDLPARELLQGDAGSYGERPCSGSKARSGFSHLRPLNRSKSESEEHSTSPYSMARAAR